MARRKGSKRKTTVPPHLARRLALFRQAMGKARLPAYLVVGRNDQFYLTGFDGEDGVSLVTARDVHIVTDGRFAEQAEVQAPWARRIIRKSAMGLELEKLRKRHRLSRVGYAAHDLTVAQASAFRKAFRPARFVKAKPVLQELRQCKDETEISAIRRSIHVAEDAFRAVCEAIRIGMTEHEVAARLDYEMRRRGAQGASFPIIVAEGPNASLPHARPGRRKVRQGSAILIDWGAIVEHYCSDLTRLVFVRRIRPRFRRMVEAVLEAQRRAIQAVRCGATTKDVDLAARGYLTSVGYGEAFSHATGHGLGLDIHEAPSLSARVATRLRPGMVVTVEPGIYFPGVGGVRIEDDILVTPDGFKRLTTLSRTPEDMIIRG